MEEKATLTAKEVFDQITELQKQLFENNFNSLSIMGNSLGDLFESETEMSGEEKLNAIEEITSVFVLRENTLQKMLTLYEKIYDDVKNIKAE